MLDIESQLSEMRVISDAVDHYYSNKLYLENYISADSVTPDSILRDCYKILIEELSDIGINLLIPIEEFLHDFEHMTLLLSLRKLVDRYELKKLFSADVSKLEYFNVLFSDPNVAESSYLHNFLDIYRTLYPNKKDGILIQPLESIIENNYAFKQHITGVIKLSYSTSSMDETNQELRLNYLRKIHEGRIHFELAITRLMRLFSHCNHEYLTHVISLYDIEKITGNMIDRLSWAVMTNNNEIHPELQKVQDDTILLHKKSATHHIEYYFVNMIHPTLEQTMELVAHHYEPDSTLDSFQKDVNEMIKQGLTPQPFTKFTVFVKEDKGLILRMAKELEILYTLNIQ